MRYESIAALFFVHAATGKLEAHGNTQGPASLPFRRACAADETGETVNRR